MLKLITAVRERVLDGADLAIDLLTLGEYGIEAGESARCEARGRSAAGVAAFDRPHHLASGLDRPLEHV
jgi:hypothetical protein